MSKEIAFIHWDDKYVITLTSFHICRMHMLIQTLNKTNNFNSFAEYSEYMYTILIYADINRRPETESIFN